MPFCHECGYTLPSAATKFCPECGTRQTLVAVTASTASTAVPASTVERKSSTREVPLRTNSGNEMYQLTDEEPLLLEHLTDTAPKVKQTTEDWAAPLPPQISTPTVAPVVAPVVAPALAPHAKESLPPVIPPRPSSSVAAAPAPAYTSAPAAASAPTYTSAPAYAATTPTLGGGPMDVFQQAYQQQLAQYQPVYQQAYQQQMDRIAAAIPGLNPRYTAPLYRILTALDADRDGWLSVADLTRMAVTSAELMAVSNPVLLRSAFTTMGARYHPETLAIEIAEYLRMQVAGMIISPDSMLADWSMEFSAYARMPGVDPEDCRVLLDMKRGDFPPGTFTSGFTSGWHTII
ncbi:hypothetical protein BC828DRAFT_398153 [Blastocladiella britannica]|nr:hypothetical protein BC828DRAFT_398153 [Blastocladiella britannica]